jgi:hypothetical protein
MNSPSARRISPPSDPVPMLLRTLAAALLVTIAAPAVVEACTCAVPQLNTRAERRGAINHEVEASDAVFFGEVTSVNGLWVQFRVTELWKGNLGSSVVLGTGAELLPGGRRVDNTCTLSFRGATGESFVVFASGQAPALLKAHRCGGTTSARHASDLLHLLAELRQSSPPRPTPEPSAAHRELIGTVLDGIQLDPGDKVVPGADLDPVRRSALESLLIPSTLENRRPLPAATVVVESVSASTDRAAVVLTYGPVPDVPRTRCGVSLRLPLKRVSTRWSVVEDGVYANCANLGVSPIVHAAGGHELRLREVFLLALSHTRLDNDARIIADDHLPPAARTMLLELGPILKPEEVLTEQFSLPPNSFKLSKLELNGDTALVEGTAGPYPRDSSLSCGTTYRLVLRAVQGGWAIVDIKMTVC